MGIELELHSKRPAKWDQSRESVLRASYSHGNALASVLTRIPQRERGRLGLIDPYGDTVFNDQEAGAALSEITAALKLCTNKQETAAIHDLAELMEACKATPGTYLWFIGD